MTWGLQPRRRAASAAAILVTVDSTTAREGIEAYLVVINHANNDDEGAINGFTTRTIARHTQR